MMAPTTPPDDSTEIPACAVSAGIPWLRIVHLALVSAMIVAIVVLWDVGRTGTHPANLLQPGADGPAAVLIAQDFPDIELASGLGLDGQQYYAMARAPLHLDVAASSLDRPIYRWQRPVFPWAARLLHPSGGGGAGLVAAFFIVGLAALVLSGVAAGVLSVGLGGRSWPAAVVPLLPGAYMSLRVTMADTLAMALLLTALALSVHKRPALAVGVACIAVLTRETVIVILIGWALAQRRKPTTLLALIPLATAGMWAVWLRMTLPADAPEKVDELGLPFVGFFEAVRDHWMTGTNRLGMVSTLGALVLVVAAWRTTTNGHALRPALWCSLGFVSLMNHNVIGIDFGATRSMLPIATVAILCLATGRNVPARTSRLRRGERVNALARLPRAS